MISRRVQDSVFRRHDVRGIVDEEIDVEFARRLGKAFVSLLREKCQKHFASDGCPSVVLGWDSRLSSPRLAQGVKQGLLESGVNVIDIGLGPSPQLYFKVHQSRPAGGIQITGSHNPIEYNGFKLMLDGRSVRPEEIRVLKEFMNEASSSDTPRGVPFGKEIRLAVVDDYVSSLLGYSRPFLGPRRLKVVTDAGSGTGGIVGPQLLRLLGCEVIELNSRPDGNFPSHHPDPGVIENLQELQDRVIRERADLGIAWDGDADRIGVVDEEANVVFGDMLLLLFGRDILKYVQRPKIIADVKCSQSLFSLLEEEGAETIMCRTGHSVMTELLKKENAAIAGELSGHMIFGHGYLGFDDALYASARLVGVLSQGDANLSTMFSDVPRLETTPEIRLECAEEIKFQVVERAKEAFNDLEFSDIDGLRFSFPHGWALVRASNTLPALTLRFEAETLSDLSASRELIEGRIKHIIDEFR